jgi:hypothetical protein
MTNMNYGRHKLIPYEVRDNEFFQELIDFALSFDYSIPGDFSKTSTYGLVNRDGKPTIVVIDYGFNKDSYNMYYGDKAKNRGVKHYYQGVEQEPSNLRESFVLNDPVKIENAYQLFKKSYINATGGAWGKEKFIQKVKKWIMFGTPEGMIAVSKQADALGAIKVTACFGAPSGIVRGFDEFMSKAHSEAVYALVDEKLSGYLTKHQDMNIIPPLLMRNFSKEILSLVFKGPPGEPNEKGGISFDIQGKKAVKYLVGNQAFFTTLLENLPEDVRNSSIVRKFTQM